MEDMKNSVLSLTKQIQGFTFAYTQSDEISILLTDFNKNTTDAWFDGNIQKICSVSASMLTAEFNRLRDIRRMNKTPFTTDEVEKSNKLATFDCRAFTIPDPTEVMNYFRARQQDCIRNSVSMVAQYHFSHDKLHGKNQSDIHEMLHKKGVNWTTNYFDSEKNGQIIYKKILGNSDDIKIAIENFFETEKVWTGEGAWVFSKDEGRLSSLIPTYE